MHKLLAVCAVTVFLATVSFGRKCYTCAKEKCANIRCSPDECKEVMEEINCTQGEDFCFSAEVEFGDPYGDFGPPQALYFANRGCATKEMCDDKSSKPFFREKDCINSAGGCSHQCCNSDLCNDSVALPMVSTFLLLACAIVTMLSH